MSPRADVPCALGLRARTGPVTAVCLAGTSREPSVVERRVIMLNDGSLPGEPYHAASRLSLAKARALVDRASASARSLATDGLRTLVRDMRKVGYRVVAAGMIIGNWTDVPPLESIMRAHPLMHGAEGELFREAVLHGARQCKLPVTGVRERDVEARTASTLGISPGGLQDRLAELGRTVGPPWRKEHKLAAATAWLALDFRVGRGTG